MSFIKSKTQKQQTQKQLINKTKKYLIGKPIQGTLCLVQT